MLNGLVYLNFYDKAHFNLILDLELIWFDLQFAINTEKSLTLNLKYASVYLDNKKTYKNCAQAECFFRYHDNLLLMSENYNVDKYFLKCVLFTALPLNGKLFYVIFNWYHLCWSCINVLNSLRLSLTRV